MGVAQKVGRYSHEGFDEYDLPAVYCVLDNPNPTITSSSSSILPRSRAD